MNEYFSLKNKKVTYTWVDSPILSWQEEIEANEYFDLKKSENPKLFNGKGISCKRYLAKGDEIELDICETDFKRNIWSRSLQKQIMGTQIIGTNIIFCDIIDKCLYLDIRSSSVEYGKGLYGAFGGMVDFSDHLITASSDEFISYVKFSAIREIEEEVEYIGSKLLESDFFDIGLMFLGDLQKISFGLLVDR